MVTFFGHNEFYTQEEEFALLACVENLILKGNKEFLIGMKGKFDSLALSVCRKLQNKYKKLEISVVFTSLSIFKKDESGFSTSDLYADIHLISYPIETDYYKNRIIKNNRYMIDDSDIIVCYIDETRKKSGAKKTVDYAKKKNKIIINLYNKKAD